MAIVLPDGHPNIGVPRRDATGRTCVRIGIINIMPRLEVYEPYLLAPLSSAPELVEPVFLRLATHEYKSSDPAHLARFYRPFDESIAARPLDGLILTGAPIEKLRFEDVRYWRELEEILQYARTNVGCTLGICWGGLALARMLGVQTRVLPRKLFGVFEDRALVAEHDLVRPGTRVRCPHSRYATVVEADVERAARERTVRPLSRGERTGYSLLESLDGRYIAHLGHPEYEAERVAFEWKRDRALARPDVDPPENFDADAPETTWRDHREAVFSAFLRRAARVNT